MKDSRPVVFLTAWLVAACLAVPAFVTAQEPGSAFSADPAFELGPMGSVRNLRASGMPVIPIFDGWIDHGDGTADLCFGYFSLNLEEERRDIPLGPDNFLEPARLDGIQPTFFLEVPPGWHRHYCVFSTRVSQGSEPVEWTLKHNGFEYSVPGHTGSASYKLDNTWYPADRGRGGEGGSHRAAGRVRRARPDRSTWAEPARVPGPVR